MRGGLMSNQIIVVDPLERLDLLKGLASEVWVRILDLLTRKGPRNVNQGADELSLPQSTISANNVSAYQKAGRRSRQKIAYVRYLPPPTPRSSDASPIQR